MKLLSSLKKIRLSALIPNAVVCLAYPVIKAVTADGDGLLTFLDSLTIISLLFILLGVVDNLYIKGDFDRVQYTFVMSRFGKRLSGAGIDKPFGAYKEDQTARHAEQFNYPLFLGILFLALSVLISYVFY